MRQLTYTIANALGLHARVAGQLVELAQHCKSDVAITKNDKTANAQSIFSVLSLAAKHGDTVTLDIDGEDEEAVCAAVDALCTKELL